MDRTILTLELPISKRYLGKHFDIHETSIHWDIELLEGNQIVTSPMIEIGDLYEPEHIPLHAQYTLHYTYSKAENMLTICANSYSSKRNLFLELMDNTKNSERFYSYSTSNSNLKEKTILPPLLTTTFQEYANEQVQSVHELIKKTALEKGIIVHELGQLPKMSDELYDNLWLVYEDGQFLEMYNPNKHYSPNQQKVHIFSVFGGTTTFPYNQSFANVRGSSHDPHIHSLSWIELWKVTCGGGVLPSPCSSLNSINGGTNNFTCSGMSVGGHIILGTQWQTVPTGANYVYIIPICHSHNMKYNDKTTGRSYFMSARTIFQAVNLHKYNQSALLENHFLSETT